MKNACFVFIVIALLSQKGISQSFQDAPSGTIGKFPSKWQAIQGQAEIASIAGQKAIMLFNKTLIKPNSGNSNYLHTEFVLEFDAYFEAVSGSFTGIHYDIRFWDGTSSTVSYSNEGGKGSVKSLIIYRHGAKLITNYNGKYTTYDEYKDELKERNASWRPIKVVYKDNTLEVFIDNVSIITIPNYGYKPRIVSFEGYAKHNGEQLLSGIKNIALTGNANATEEQDDNTGPDDMGDTEADDTTNTTTSVGSGLEAINEGQGTGWRLKGVDPNKYGNIGVGAVDLSLSYGGNGNQGATGVNAIALGADNTASGNYAAVMGSFSRASGDGSVAINGHASGKGSFAVMRGQADGDKSLAIGTGTKTLGEHTIAIGRNNMARGNHTIAIGTEAEASVGYSTAIGYKTEANALYATAMGHETNADSYGVLAIGRHNKGFGNRLDWLGVDPILEVGVGEDANNTKNALTILKNGNVGITTHLPQTKLQVTGGTDVSLNNGSGYFTIGKESTKNLAFDNNEIIARNNGQTSILYLQHEGGDVHVGGSVVQSSDMRLKRDIDDLTYGLNEILQLNPKTYYWKNKEDDKKSIGLIAQDVQPVLNEIVINGDDENSNLSLNYTSLIPVLINAIKEQQATIDKLSEDIIKKESALNELNTRVKQIEALMNSAN